MDWFSYNVNTLDMSLELRNKEAVLPSYAHKDDVGMDLTAIQLKKTMDYDGFMYDTGIAVKPPDGYYFEIIPRSSFSKTGFVQPHGIGIIDPSYTGNLYIVVRKQNQNVPDLKTPFCLFQLVLRKLPPRLKINIGKLDKTVRGAGGFGSTNK